MLELPTFFFLGLTVLSGKGWAALGLPQIWFVYLREPLRRLKLVLTARPARLAEGRYRSLLGWDGRVLDEEADSASYALHCADPIVPEPPDFHAFQSRLIYKLNGAVAWPEGGVLLKGHPVVEAGNTYPTKAFPRIAALDIALWVEPAGIYSGAKKANYYHWLIEDLPAVLRAHASAPGLTVFLGGPIPKYASASLGEAKVSFKKLSVPTRFGELVLGGRGHDSGWPHRDDLSLLRDTFLTFQERQSEQGKKIFISRRNSRRAFSNESDLERLLSSKGFTTYVLEDLSFQEQVRLFSHAGYVVGAHGAGLSNLVFCPKGTKVLEISTPSHAVNCFRVLSKQLDFEHETVVLSSDWPRRPLTVSASEMRVIGQHLDSMLFD